MPHEQYGSRKQKIAIDHAVHKCLLYDIINIQRGSAMLCSNDAASCYDHIVHSIASLAIQCLSLPSQPIQCMLVTIQELHHQDVQKL